MVAHALNPCYGNVGQTEAELSLLGLDPGARMHWVEW